MVRRSLGLTAAIISGATLLLLLTISLFSAHVDLEEDLTLQPSLLIEETTAPHDPAATLAEVVGLQRVHGSALSGSCLETIESSDSFAGAVAQVAGLQSLPEVPASVETPATSNVVNTLRSSAHQYEQLAHQLELQQQYEQADQLRELAAGVRHVSRQISADQPQHLLTRQPAETETR